MRKRHKKNSLYTSLGLSSSDVKTIRNHPDEWKNYRDFLDNKIQSAKREGDKPLQTVCELLLIGWEECDQAAYSPPKKGQ